MTTAAPAAPAAPAAATPAAPAPAATPAAPVAAPAQPAAQTPGQPAAPAAAVPAQDGKGTILGGGSNDGSQPGAVQKEGAPEKYADFKLPEGVEAKAEMMEQFKATAKELGLSQSSAQKLVDLQAQSVKAELDGRMAEFNAQIGKWGEEARTAFGAEWKQQFAIASKAVERFGSPALRQVLNETGLGNHPELVKFFAKVGARISEDQPIEGRSAGGDRVPTEKLMFPTMEKKSS